MTKVVSEEPVDEVAQLPPGCYCIVMTHNHQLDLELTAAILKRNDFTWFGLIGSKTKRVKFEHRLRERATTTLLARMRALWAWPRSRQAAHRDRGVHCRRNHRHLQRLLWPARRCRQCRPHCPVAAALPAQPSPLTSEL